MSFQHEIELWDGKTVAALDAIFARYSQQNEFVTALITYLEELVLQVGASWLLKKVAESDRTFSLSEVGTIYTLLPQLEAWQTKLHLLQLLPFLPINNKQKEPVKTFLRACLLDNNKFVHAWAYNGFDVLAHQHAAYRTEATAPLERALHEEAPSVKARVRSILKTKRL